MMVVMKSLRSPLLHIHGDKELAQIAAALEIPLGPEQELVFFPPWHLSLPHVFIASIGALLFGYHAGILNATLEFIAEDLGLVDNTLAQGWIVSICLVGALIGSIFSGTLADELGRRRSSQLSILPVIIGSCLSALASNLQFMIAGRFLVGVGLGIGGPAAALYVTEISPSAYRGTFGALAQITACLGFLGALIAGLPVAIISGWWRTCFWISIIPSTLLGVGLEMCSESPRWLFKKGRWVEAEIAIKRLWGASNLKAAVAELVQGEAGEKVEEISYIELFTKPYLRVLLIGAGIFIFQQFSGISAVFLFSSTFFKNAGVTSNLAASVCVGIVNLAASCVAALLMDRVGRRTLLIWSFFGMSLGMAVQAITIATPASLRGHNYVLLAGTLFYVLMFAIGVGPVPFALLPEIFPNRIRAKAMAVSMSIYWLANCFLGLLYLPIIHKFGASWLYTFFTAVCFLGVIFVKEYVVETNGRTLEDIEASLFGSGDEA